MDRNRPHSYDFDRVIDRRGSHSAKYAATEGLASDYDDIIPLWVADMDFETPQVIRDAITESISRHPVLGYSVPPSAYFETLVEWFRDEYRVKITPDEVKYTSGVVAAIYKLLECLTEKGDGVTILPPVYFPFSDMIRGSERLEVTAPLLIRDGRYFIDFDKLDAALSESKVMIFCHPHNPGGRVWSEDEIRQVVHLAKRHGVTIISDEIHADLTYRTSPRHIPLPAVCEEAKAISVCLMAPSKFFNMPGVVASHMYIPDPGLRAKVFDYFEANHLSTADCFTYDAVIAAYRYASGWAKDAVDYCEANVRYVCGYIEEELSTYGVGTIRPEASFLVFIDFRDAGFSSPEELHTFVVQKAGVLMNDGSTFGEGGEFFLRLNVGTSRSILEEVMRRLRKALQDRAGGEKA